MLLETAGLNVASDHPLLVAIIGTLVLLYGFLELRRRAKFEREQQKETRAMRDHVRGIDDKAGSD